jgi:hypothetical protein
MKQEWKGRKNTMKSNEITNAIVYHIATEFDKVTIPRTMLDEMIALLQTHGKGTKQKVLAMLKEVAR